MQTLVILALLMPAAAVAQPPAASSNPNALICRVTGETGSRLQRSRTCKTRAQWDELRREQRNTLDRAQTQQVNRTVDEALRGN
jgi:hypothetical protein